LEDNIIGNSVRNADGGSSSCDCKTITSEEQYKLSQIMDAALLVADGLSMHDTMRFLGEPFNECEQFNSFPPTYERASAHTYDLDVAMPAAVSYLAFDHACHLVKSLSNGELQQHPEPIDYQHLIDENSERLQRLRQAIQSAPGNLAGCSSSSIRLEYQTALREILEAEATRRTTNTKRGGRFTHHLPMFAKHEEEVLALKLNVTCEL
jgi:hypothetical protein